MNTILPWLGLGIRLVIGGYFLYAAVPKIAEPLPFATSIMHYELMPAWAINAFALVIPWLEVLVAVCLLVGYRVRTSALVTAGLLVMFTTAVAIAFARGLEIDCGCFGDQGGDTVGWPKILTNTAMIAGCLLLAYAPRTHFALDARRTDGTL